VNDDKLFVNLSLSKNVKLKTAFGDGEAGMGTQKKYFLNPVLFSLYGKLKMGYIGNWNNVGNGIGWKEEDELKSAPVRTAEQWMMQSNQLMVVNDLENQRYITNGQLDNRFQINIPITKKIKSTTEIDLIKDRQRQLIYNSSSLYNGTDYIQEKDTSTRYNQPYSLLLRQNVVWNIDSSKSLSSQISLYHNGDNSSSNSVYNQTGVISDVQNSITNNWNSYLFSLSYTHRSSAKKAVKWFADLSEHNYPQKVINISDSWPSIFQLPDSGYDVLNQHTGNKEKMATLGWASIIKTKKGILETGILLNALAASVETDLLLNNVKDSAPMYPKGYNNQGKYYTSSAVGYTRKTIRLFKQFFSVKGEYGFGTANKSEDSSSHFSHLLYSLDANTQNKFGKYFNGKFDVSFSQRQFEAYKLYGILLPNYTNNFHNNLNVGLPFKMFNTSYNLSVSWKPQFVVGLYAMYGTNFSGLSSINHLRQFIQFSSDSFTRRPLNNYFVSFNTNIFSLKHHFHFSADIGYNVTQRFIQSQSNLLKTNSSIFYINTTLTKSWRKIYFIEMNANYTNIGFKLPVALQTQVAQNVSDIKASLSQRVAINKHSNVVLVTDFFDKNMFTSHHLSFLIADAEYNFTIPKSPLSFAIRLQNITNQTKYTYIDNSPLIQSFFSIPLVKRNIFVSVRYEL